MQPVDLSTQAQNLGPGTGGLWLGEQQRNAMQESELNQQNTLEQIAASKQKREFEGQLQPGALERQKLENVGQGLKNTGEQNKLDKDNYTNYSNDVIAYAAAGHSPMEIAAYQDQAAKRHKLDSSDERVRMVGGIAAQGTTAIAKWKEVMLHMDPKYREEMDKQELVNRGTRQNAEIHGLASMYGADSAAAASRYGADQRAATAQQRVQQFKQSTDQLEAQLVQEAMKETDPARKAAIGQYISFLRQGKIAVAQAASSGKVEDLERTLNMFQQKSMEMGAALQAPPPRGATPPALPGATAAPATAQSGNPPAVTPQPAPAAAQAPQAGVTQIKDDAGFAALASGALFVGPDGVTRRKP